MKQKPGTTQGRKGTIGNHGNCQKCGVGRERRHNAYWCPACHYVEHPRVEEKDA